jgi:hypothetical protein
MRRTNLFKAALLGAALACSIAPAHAQFSAGLWKPPGGAAPTINWITGNSIGTGCTTTVCTTGPSGNTITSGDYLFVIGGSQDGGPSIDHTPFTCTNHGGGGTAWATTSVSTGSNDNYGNQFGSSIDIFACGRVAGSGETGQVDITWTTANNRYGMWLLVDIKCNPGPCTGSQIDDAGNLYTGENVQSFDAPSVTATKSDDLLITVYALQNGDPNDPVTHSAGTTLQKNTFDATYEPEWMLFTSNPASGATGTINVTTGGASSGIGTGGEGWNILFKGS